MCHHPAYRQVGPGLNERRYELIADNCRRLIAQEPLNYVVLDKTLGF